MPDAQQESEPYSDTRKRFQSYFSSSCRTFRHVLVELLLLNSSFCADCSEALTRFKMSTLLVERSSRDDAVVVIGCSVSCFRCWLLRAMGSLERIRLSASRPNRSASFWSLAFASRPSTWIWISCWRWIFWKNVGLKIIRYHGWNVDHSN